MVRPKLARVDIVRCRLNTYHRQAWRVNPAECHVVYSVSGATSREGEGDYCELETV